MEVVARQTDGVGVTYLEAPVDGSTSGEIYTAQPIHIDHFSKGKFAGNVGIGTDPSDAYVLSANGTIRAREIKVDSEIWADYVFDNDYKLMPIEQVANFIDENGHLPNIPNAKTVKKDGISVGEMNAKLLEKIEELTLYVIKQQQAMDEVKQKMQKQDEIINTLQMKLNQKL
ncbi:hypothetical protein EYV94_21510 [Puteibacter caeruleilacunae]|nr:hypothetical protein EYV94_21510 [Puteibacter caeruleilacunae]